MENSSPDFFEQREISRRKNLRHDELFSSFRAGNIPTAYAHWHHHIDDIDFSLQRDGINSRVLVEGLTVLNDVDIEKLFDEFSEADAAMYRRNQLYNPSLIARNISTVWDAWLNNTKLIPPTILVFDQAYSSLIARGTLPSTEFRPTDGKHRLNVAYFFGARSIPIVVWKPQLEMIEERLGM